VGVTALEPRVVAGPLDGPALAAYTERIGVTGPLPANAATLQRLVTAHTATIPFEGLDAFVVREPELTQDAMIAKLVRGRRGGWCFEQNGLFRRALDALGFATTSLSARVRWVVDDDAPPTARAHEAVLVDLPEGSYLADVGFGGMVPTGALRLEHGVEQATPLEPFRLLAGDDDVRGAVEWTLEALVDGAWKAVYTFDLTPAEQIDAEMASHYLVSRPDSLFRTTPVAVLPGSDRRTNLMGRSLVVHHLDGPTERTDLGSPSAIRDALEERFGLDLSGLEGLDDALARLF
jgi:arylamine N-acetyltransferase